MTTETCNAATVGAETSPSIHQRQNGCPGGSYQRFHLLVFAFAFAPFLSDSLSISLSMANSDSGALTGLDAAG